MKEKTIVKKITDRLKDRPHCWFFKSHGSLYQMAGLPDIIGCDSGIFFGIEAKRPGEQPRPLQRAVMRRIAEAGGRVGRAESWEEAENILEHGNPDPDRYASQDAPCASPVELLFWQEAEWRIPGLRRQYPVDGYVVDFAIPDLKRVIEIDGAAYHSSEKAKARDAQKDARLGELGWKVLRFSGSEVFDDTLRCVEKVLAAIK